MSYLDSLSQQRDSCCAQLTHTRQLLQKAEQDFESLYQFKNEVERNLEDFAFLNNKNTSSLRHLDPLQRSNLCARNYDAGMGFTLTQVGSCIVAHSLEMLLERTRTKLDEYRQQISDYESIISAKEHRIDVLNSSIRAEEQRMAAEAQRLAAEAEAAKAAQQAKAARPNTHTRTRI